MTEAEAKTKWCPFAYVPIIGVQGKTVAVNRMPGNMRDNDFHDGSRCMGSACMAWRFVPGPMPQVQDGGAVLKPSGAVVRPMKDAPERRNGYCGLAGQS